MCIKWLDIKNVDAEVEMECRKLFLGGMRKLRHWKLMWRKGRDKNLPPCLETFKILYDVKDRMKLSCCLCPSDFFVYFSNLISGLISLLNTALRQQRGWKSNLKRRKVLNYLWFCRKGGCQHLICRYTNERKWFYAAGTLQTAYLLLQRASQWERGAQWSI